MKYRCKICGETGKDHLMMTGHVLSHNMAEPAKKYTLSIIARKKKIKRSELSNIRMTAGNEKKYDNNTYIFRQPCLKKKKFVAKTDDQKAWAAKLILEAMCERIQDHQKAGKLILADGYIANLILKEVSKDD